MPNPGLFLAVCALIIAADGLAGAVEPPARPAPDPQCRFTLERNSAPFASDDSAETWVLTCHRATAQRTPSAGLDLLRPDAAADPAVGY